MVVLIGSLSVWFIVIPFTTVVKVEENDLTLKVTGGSQQAVDVVRRTVSQGERQQLLPSLQVSVSFALTQQTAHIPGQTVAWRKEKGGSYEGFREAVREVCIHFFGIWRQTLSLKIQKRWCDMDKISDVHSTTKSDLSFSSCNKQPPPTELYSDKQTQLLLLLLTDREQTLLIRLHYFLSPHQPFPLWHIQGPGI